MIWIIIIAVILLIVLAVNIPVTAYIRYHDGEADVKVSFLFKQLYPHVEKKKRQKRKRKKHRKNIKKAETKPASEEISFNEPDAPEEPTAPPDEDKQEKPLTEDTTPEENSEEENSEVSSENTPKKHKPKKKSLFERLNTKLDELNEKKISVQLAFELLKGPLKKLGGKVRIDDLKIDFAAADEDAYEAAMLYGKVNAAVYNALSAVRCFVPVSVTGIKIDCLFNTPAEKCRWDGECKIRLRPASLLNAIIAVVFGYAKDKEKYAPVMALFK